VEKKKKWKPAENHPWRGNFKLNGLSACPQWVGVKKSPDNGAFFWNWNWI
jgi:hypothetical protein